MQRHNTYTRSLNDEINYVLLQLELERQSESGDVSNYQANGEFDLVDFSATRNVQFYSCCPEPYPDITYEIRLRRRPLFYVFNLILPCILINGIGEIFIYIGYCNSRSFRSLFSIRVENLLLGGGINWNFVRIFFFIF